MKLADTYRMPVSELGDWHPHDRDAAFGLRQHEAESCPECSVHPSVWKPSLGGHMNAVVAVWKHCRPCEVLARARDAGPPDKETPGWHLVLEHQQHKP